jgi:hypothetical protein
MAIMKDQERASDQEETTTEKSQASVAEARNLATDLLEKEEMNAMRIVASEVKTNAVQKEDSTKVVTMKINTAIAVTLEALLATSVASTTKVVVMTDQNVKVLNIKVPNVVAAVASKEEKKIHSTTDQELLDKSVLTNTSPTLASAHAVKLMTSSSLAQCL